MLNVLRLDSAWNPHSWINHEEAATCYVKGDVVKSLGEPCMVMHGGINGLSGKRSMLDLYPIIVTNGLYPKAYGRFVPPFSRQAIYRRDRGICMFCNTPVKFAFMTLDHIIPECQGGKRTFQNIVLACRSCNKRKGARSPSQAGMEILAVPYVPNKAESLLLAARGEPLADQMAFLLARVGKNSRLLQ